MIVVTVEQVITYSDPAILVVVPIVVIVFLVVFIVVVLIVVIVAIVAVGKLIVASEQVPPSATVVVFTGEVLEVCLRAV